MCTFTQSPKAILPHLALGLMASITTVLLVGCDNNHKTNAHQSTTAQSSPASTTDSKSTAEPVTRIAAAANLSGVLPQILTAFTQSNPDFAKQKIEVTYASSGKIYTQITQNAPYDIFLSANQDFPAKLVQEGAGKYGKPFTYTQGQLALYSTTKTLGKDAVTTIQQNFPANLDKNSPIKLAIANPELAPYGKSAQSWLDSQKLNAQVKDHLVMGDNIEQTFTFANTGNADFGLVAVSQLLGNATPAPTSRYLILPVGSYPAIKQDGVILKTSPTSEAFVKFLLSPQAQAILVKSGYLPIA